MHFIHSSMILTWKKFPFPTQRKNSKRDSRPVFRFKIQAWHSFHYFLTSLKFHNYDVTPMLYFSTPNQNTYSITRSRYLLQKRSKRATAMNFVHFCVTLVNRKVLRWGASSFTAQSYTRARGRTIDHEFPARTGKFARKWRTVNVKKVFFLHTASVKWFFQRYKTMLGLHVFGNFMRVLNDSAPWKEKRRFIIMIW